MRESCGLKLDPIEEMLIEVGVGDMFGFWWHWGN